KSRPDDLNCSIQPLFRIRSIVYLFMRLFLADCKYAEVFEGKYPPHHSEDRPHSKEVLESTVDASSLLAFATEVQREAEIRRASSQDKAKTLLTLCALLLTALSFLVKLNPPPWPLAALAFISLFAAVLMLLRHLRVGVGGHVSLTREMLEMNNDAFLREHAASILNIVAQNGGVTDFLVDVQRVATRALVVGLLSTLGVAFFSLGTQSELPVEEVRLPDQSEVLIDSLIKLRLPQVLDSLGTELDSIPSPEVHDGESSDSLIGVLERQQYYLSSPLSSQFTSCCEADPPQSRLEWMSSGRFAVSLLNSVQYQ
ncbi:hypothetical protein MJD09_10045, partial [bacterium]|nr:hypothetical protein [bacterium]